MIHNLVLEGGPSTPDLSNGESAVLDVGELEPGVYTLFCSISGHREAGMETTISVEQGTEASGGRTKITAMKWIGMRWTTP